MARIGRVVVPGYPHHIVQRGNRRQDTFFCKDDYRMYLSLMQEWTKKCNVDVWSYCLMTNHVHLIMVPENENGLHKAISEMHRRYTHMINFRNNWRGHLWQGRFSSFVMDEKYALAAARYIEMNPVKAGLADKAWKYEWSSAKAHILMKNDGYVNVRPLLEMAGDWKAFLTSEEDERVNNLMRSHEKTGRPLGGTSFIVKMEGLLGRKLLKNKPGPKPKAT